MVQHFLRAVPINAPSLEAFEVDALGNLSKQSEAAVLECAKRVACLSLQAVAFSTNFLADLASVSQLRKLVLEFTLATTNPTDQWKPGIYDTMEDFECQALNSQKTLSLLEAVTMPNLIRLKITIGTVLEDEIKDKGARHEPCKPISVFRILLKVATFPRLKSLVIILPDLDEDRLTLSPSLFLPLCDCRSIESFEVQDRSGEYNWDLVFVDWDDAHITSLCESWPRLRKLHLECSNASAPTTRLTVKALSALAELCPELSSLRMPINMSDAGTHTFVIPTPSNKLYQLILEASTLVANDALVADLIHALWPGAVVRARNTNCPESLTAFQEYYQKRYLV